MSQPTAYAPAHSFVADSATLANFPGQAIDVEFQALKTTTDQVRTNLALIQRDDGQLANGVVTYDSLSASVQSNGLTSAAAWVTATTYLVGNVVVSSNTVYRCLVAHTSGVFATDLAALNWILVTSLVYSAGTNITFAGSVISVSTSPAFTTPNIGVATATSINGNTFTAGSYTLTGVAGKTLTFNNNLTLAGTDGTTLTFQGTDTYVGRATTDTLTNKTLTAPAINGATLLTSTYNNVTITAPATSAVLTLIDGTTVTGPAASDTLVGRASADTFTGVKTFGSAGAVGKLAIAGTTSGSTILNATAVASGTLTLPAATDTLVGKATTDTLTNKTIDTAGTGNHIQISGVDITRGQILGEASTTSASAGNIGEYIETVVALGSAVSLSTGTAKDIATLTLTAGDWDISAEISYVTAATTSVTNVFASISATLNTLDQTAGRVSGGFFQATVPNTSNTAFNVPVGPVRFSISGSTTYHLVALGTFTVAALTAYGIIRARRMR